MVAAATATATAAERVMGLSLWRRSVSVHLVLGNFGAAGPLRSSKALCYDSPTMAELAPGSTFADHVILDLAGRGGMGVVYHALHEPLNRHVALKLIAPELSADSMFRSRFQRECKAAASIHHPNVVPIYNAGEEQGRLFVSMQYIDGADLGRVLALEERLAWGRAATLVADIADGIDAAHQLGIVHRDVKPANVLIESTAAGMHPFLTDFGLAKCVTGGSQVTRTGAILGTLDYAAPEQLEESEVDGRTDVYALGCVLFHALTGRVPYPRETNAGKILAHLQAAPPSVTFLAPDVPEPLASVVQRAMCKDPADRYPTAGELGRAALAAVAAVEAGTPPVDDTNTVTITTGAPARTARAPGAVRAGDGAFPAGLARDDRDTPFVGRRDIIDRLAHRYALADAGRRQFVVLCGEPGAGKTRVAAEFARRAYAEPATVLYGRSDAESIVPYQPFITAIGQYFAHHDTSALAAELDLELAELGRFIPSLHRSVPALLEPLAVEPDARRYRLFEAVTRVLEYIAAERPVVLILDDLHWADSSTALLLRHAVQQLHDVRLLLLGTLRDVEACRADDLTQLLARLGPEGSFERIMVPGLDARETADLVVAHEIGAPTEGFVRSLRRATDGNPLFINETLKSLSETESPSNPGVVSERMLDRVGVPDVAQEMIAQRIQRLEATTRTVLAAAAVVGRSFHLRVLEVLLAEPVDEIIDALEEASAAGLIREADDDIDRFEFSHALVRDALCEQQSASRRIRVHHRIGEALEQVGSAAANPAELAHHFFASRHIDGGHKALRYSVQAGDAAARALAHDEAIEHYRRALTALDTSAPDDEQRRCEVLLALAGVELRQGDPAARRSFQEAAELARRGGRPEQLGRAALGVAGRHAEAGIVDREAIAVLEEALAGLGADRSALRAQLMASLADALQFAQEPSRTAALSHDALVLAREIGDTHTLVAALESRHTALLHIEHLDERLRLSDEFLSLAEDIHERELKAVGLHWRIYDLLEAGDVAAARRAHEALAALADELRQPLYHHFAVAWDVVWAQMEGRAADSERLAGEALELGTQAQARDAETLHAIQVIALRRREDLLSDYVSTIETAIDKHPSLVAWRAVLPLANLAAGNVAEALAQFERLAQDDFARLPRDMFWFTAVCVLGEACALIGDRERAERLYAMLLPFKDRNVQVTQAAFWGSAERFLGLLAAALGRWDTAFEHLESAIAKNEASGCRVAAGLVRRDYAELLLARRAPGDFDAAVALLREMLEAATGAGMSVVTSRLQARLDELAGEG
jgi:tetratricopeptide (TPR) repeat protein